MIMRRLRLAFLSSKAIINWGGSTQALEHDFNSALDPDSERMSYDFLIHALEEHLSNLKSESHYEAQMTNEVTSLSEYNQRNLA
jgi:hypothetical protein